jgi:hypothetical protein
MADQIQVQISAEIAQLISGLNDSAAAVKASADEMKGSFEDLKASSEKSSDAIVENLQSIKEQADSTVEGIKHLIETLGIMEGIKFTFEFVMGGADIAEKLDLLSKSTGLTTTELSRLKFVAEESGMSIDEVGMAVNRMNLRMQEMARTGSGPAMAGLKDLHIDQIAFAAADASQKFQMLGDAIQRFGNTSRVLGDIGEVIGRNGARMVPFLEAIKEGEKESDQLGATLAGPVIAAADQFADATKNLGSQWDALKVTVAAALAGPLTGVVAVMEAAVKQMIVWGNNGDLQRWALEAGDAIADFAVATLKTLSTLATALQQYIDKWNDMLAPIRAVTDVLNSLSGAGAPTFASGGIGGKGGSLGDTEESASRKFLGPTTSTDVAAAAAASTGIAADLMAAAQVVTDAKDKAHAAAAKAMADAAAEAATTGKPNEDQGPQAASTAAIAAAKKARAEAFAEFVLEQKLEIAEANNTATAKIAAYQKVYNEAVALFGAQSKQARAAAVEEAQAVEAGLKEKLKAQLDDAKNSETIAKGALAVQQAQDAQMLASATSAARLRLAMAMEDKQAELADLISIGDQEVAAEQAIATQKYNNLHAQLARELEDYQKSGLDKTEEIKKTQAAIIAAEENYEAERTKIATKGATERSKLQAQSAAENLKDQAALFTSIFDPIASGIDTLFTGIISGTQKTSVAFRKMADDLLLSFAKSGLHDLLLGGTAGGIGSKIFGEAGKGGGIAGLIASEFGGPAKSGLLGSLFGGAVEPSKSADVAQATTNASAIEASTHPLFDSIVHAIEALKDAIVSAVGAGKTPVAPGPANTAAIAPINPGGQLGATAGGTLANSIVAGFTGGGVVGALSTAMKAAFQEAGTVLTTVFKTAFEGIGTVLQPVFTKIFDLLPGILQSGLKSLASLFTGGASIAVGGAAKAGIGAATSTAVGGAAGSAPIVTAITALGTLLTTDLVTLGTTITTDFLTQTTALLTPLSAIATATASAAASLLKSSATGGMGGMGGGALSSLGGGIGGTGAADAIAGPFGSPDVVSQLTSSFGTAFTNNQSTLSTVFGSIFSSLPSILPLALAPFGLAHGGIIPSARDGMLAGGGTLAILHPREMVLPADLSEGMQLLFKERARGSSSGIVQGGHTINISYGDISAIDARGIEGILQRHAATVSKVVMGHLDKNGGRLKAFKGAGSG